MKRRWLPFAMLAVVMLLWSGNSIVGRAVREDIPPFTLAFIRWLGALIVVLPFAVRPILADRAALLRGWKPVLFLGLTGVAGFNAFLYSGLRHTTATNALLLQAGIPALVLLFDRTVFGMRPSGRQVLGVVLSVTGVLAIIARGVPAALLHLHFGFGDLLILAGVLAWALYTSLLKLRPAVQPLSFLAVTFAIAAATMAPLAAGEWLAGETVRWNAMSIAGCLYVALFPSVIAYGLYNAAVADLGGARAGQTITLMPLIGALLAAATLGEQLFGFHLTGMVLILAGILASNLKPRRTD